MTEHKAFADSNETPEDVATLYSWANLHGAKYRDFSAARAQTRENTRQRVQDALEAERRGAREEAEAQERAESQLQPELASEQRAVDETLELPIQDQQPAARGIWTPQSPAFRQQQYSVWQPTAHLHAAPKTEARQPQSPALSSAEPVNLEAQPSYYAPQSASQNAEPRQGHAPVPPAREERAPQSGVWAPADPRENPTRPAWLNPGPNEAAAAAAQHPLHDTLQGSRDRIASRWYALKGIFAGAAAAPATPMPAPATSRAPVLAVFSLAGGVGKTSLVATLGRTLSARGERVLLIDTAAYGLLPYFFGARDQRPGVLRTFMAPGNAGDAPVQLLSIDCENLAPESAQEEQLSQEITRNGYGASRILVDLATASGAITRRVLRMNPAVLVPIMPDMSSVVSVGAIDAFFQRNGTASGQPVMPRYLLNQFDPSFPLHLDVREVLREQLGDRLLPFSMRRTPAVSEALAEGMTVVDYAPNSPATDDFANLTAWVKSLAAPASGTFRGVRWSER